MANTEKKARKVNPYTEETIRKVVSLLVALYTRFMAMLASGKKLNVSISSGNSKIGHTLNVSLAPIICCGNCKECKYFCYDIKACNQYENVRIARAKNTAIFNNNRDDFFNQIWEKMSRKRTNKFLRFHVSGEIKDYDHFDRIVETAKKFPEFRIWTYTKMYEIVNLWIACHGGKKEAIPENLVVMFSEWKGMEMPNPYGMPTFRCVSEEEEKPDCMKCPGNCNFCKENETGCIYGNSVYTDLH